MSLRPNVKVEDNIGKHLHDLDEEKMWIKTKQANNKGKKPDKLYDVKIKNNAYQKIYTVGIYIHTHTHTHTVGTSLVAQW